jgi:hypothetical protein
MKKKDKNEEIGLFRYGHIAEMMHNKQRFSGKRLIPWQEGRYKVFGNSSSVSSTFTIYHAQKSQSNNFDLNFK